jgi:pimeloyl-ACP methyl ester carboxylesterase
VSNAVQAGVGIPIGAAVLEGDLIIPEDATGLVLFAHGSGSSRHSPRNRFVAETLNDAAIGTLLIDLLTPEEEAHDQATGELRFDIGLLATRVIVAVDWLRFGPGEGLRIGLFGASTGAAGALVAAAERSEHIGALVSRGGRPDLAGAALPRVRAPTLLIVGALDRVVLELNQHALELIPAEKQLVVVPGATHLFEEPGALEEVARLATEWFSRHLGVDGDG